MGLLKRINILSDLTKHGGTINIKGHLKYLEHYFEIDNKSMKLINKMLRTRNKYYCLIGNTWNVTIHRSIETIKEELSISSVLYNHVYTVGDEEYIVVNRNAFLELVDQDKITIEEVEFSHSYSTNEYNNNYSNNSLFGHTSKSPKSKKYDWDEAYEEGLEEFGNEEDAEAYADDHKR